MFRSKAIVGSHDIYLDAVPVSTQSVLSPSGSDPVTSVSVCRSLSHLSDDAIVEPSEQNNLIYQLRQYYHDVKTKRQLNFEVPAGFRQTGIFQRNLKDHFTATNTSDLPDISMLYEESTQDSTSLAVSTESITHSSPLPNESSDPRVPILRCVDKPSSSLPSRITLNEDFIRASVGPRRIDMIRSQFSSLYQDTIKFDNTPGDVILDSGALATVRKTPRNTTPVPRPTNFGDVIHMDIVFGP